MDHRRQKQFIVGIITFVVVFGVGFAITFLLTRSEPPPYPYPYPTPVEPGPKLENIEIIFSELFEVRKTGTYDAAAYITNPNIEYGASDLLYEFILIDSEEREVLKVAGHSFILPQESRYIMEPAIKVPIGKPVGLRFRLVEVEWQQLARFSASELGMRDIRIKRDEEAQTTQFSGVVENRTPYNFKNVEVQVAMYDPNAELAPGGEAFNDPRKKGTLIAVGETNMQDLLRNTDRFFKITWPDVLPPNLDFDARVESNFFENSNFLKEFGKPGKFKEYY